MELQFIQIAIAEDGKTVLGLTQEGAVYYKLGTVTGTGGWRRVAMDEASEKDADNDRILRRGVPTIFG